MEMTLTQTLVMALLQIVVIVGFIMMLVPMLTFAERKVIAFVQVREHAETVLVYIAPEKTKCKVLVLAIERGELTLVELKLSPHEMQVWLRQPGAAAVRNVSR